MKNAQLISGILMIFLSGFLCLPIAIAIHLHLIVQAVLLCTLSIGTLILGQWSIKLSSKN